MARKNTTSLRSSGLEDAVAAGPSRQWRPVSISVAEQVAHKFHNILCGEV
jgi:hypothetical protein